MPRTRKTIAGDKAQPIQAPPGRPYGQGKQLEEAQRAVPAPDATADDVRSRPPSPSAALQIAQAHEMPPPAPLTGPSQRASEPVTTGMRLGPGAGPEIMMNQQVAARRTQVLNDLAADSRSPRLRRLAERARRSG